MSEVKPLSSPRSGELLARVTSGIVMIAVALATLWMGGVTFVIFWTLCAIATVYEWQTLINAPKRWERVGVGSVAVALSVMGLLSGYGEVALGTVLLGALLAAGLAGPGKRVWAGAGVLYGGALALSVVLLRVVSALDGAEAILWLFALVWGTDIMAYFGGRSIGGPKLWPRVSPSKTWSGFIVGVTCGALLGGAAVALTLGGPNVSLGMIFLLGLMGGVIAQGGDLMESSVKRHFGVKDSSQLIPGHGGFMDRLDGFIATASFAALVGLAKAAGPGFVATGLLRW
jgi:phosphatidate cytidylyltransferase